MALTSMQHLPSFLAVAQHQSFSRAAKALGVSTSALSQAVRALEAQVGAPLLVRTTRSVAVTVVGQRLAARAGPALREAAEALEAAATLEGELSGLLRVNLPALALQPVLLPVLPVFLARFPKVRVELWVENRLVNIVAERFDAGVRLVEAVQRDMVTARLTGPFRFVVVGSPAYLRARGTPQHPRELSGHTCIGFRSPTTGALAQWDLERKGKVHKVTTDGRVSTNHDGALVELAARGVGLSYVAQTVAAAHLAAGRLQVVLPEWGPEVPGLFLYYPSRSQASATLKAFIACARETLRP